MSVTQTSRRARDYARYTGAPRQLACETVAALTASDPLIPAAAEPVQCLLESEVLHQVLFSQRDFFEFPFGIRYVEPTTAGVRLHVESAKALDSLLSGLLPARFPIAGRERDEIYGVNGLRICARGERGIELRRLGQPTSLKLTGPSRRAFERAEAAAAQRVEESGGQACWRAGEAWTDYEEQWEADRQPLIHEPTWSGAAWLPSGLLRRLGLLHTVAVPHFVTGHNARVGKWWILHLEHFADTGLRRAELVEALTDPANGLPLYLRGYRDPEPDGGLGLVLLKAADDTVTLQLRYERVEYRSERSKTPERADMTAAIRRRVSALAGEAQLPPMPQGCATG